MKTKAETPVPLFLRNPGSNRLGKEHPTRSNSFQQQNTTCQRATTEMGYLGCEDFRFFAILFSYKDTGSWET